jgi:hypothetical protein
MTELAEHVNRQMDEALSHELDPDGVLTAMVHACPPEGSSDMPCCGRTPFEVPAYDRITADEDLVTCHPGVRT